MEYRRLGQSGLKVSEIALGSWLTFGGSIDDDTAFACVRQAFDLGINFFDTANAYNRGAAEVVMGKALAQFPRSSYVLATKVYFGMGEGPNDSGLSRKHIMEQCHASLKRLGVDYIDLYQCHRYDRETPLEETLRALDDLVTQGKVLYVGVSEWNAAQITDAVHISRELNLDQIASNQPGYNMLRRDIEKEVIPTCERYGIGQVVFSPLAQGILTGKYRAGQEPPAGSRAAGHEPGKGLRATLERSDVQAKVDALRGIAEAKGISLAQLALAWVLRLPSVSSAIIGASRPQQVAENAAAAGVKLSPEEQAQIAKILEG